MSSKLKVPDRISLNPRQVVTKLTGLFHRSGFTPDDAAEIAAHLVESDLSGVESHGIARTMQYVREVRSGKLNGSAIPLVSKLSKNQLEVTTDGGSGIPAMRVAVSETAKAARQEGLAVCAVRGAGHTGRLGAFAERAAELDMMTILIGGGNRHAWRQVAPFGGIDPLLPTNPYCIGIPGGERGPIVLDFATAKIAGGWIYAARDAGVAVPEGALIDKNGQPTTNPNDFFKGGAIVTKGEQLGSGLAIMAEMVCHAMLGPVDKGETNWLVLSVDCSKFREKSAMQEAAEEVLSELRGSRPAQGFDHVSIPGERERQAREQSQLWVPAKIWAQIEALDGGQ